MRSGDQNSWKYIFFLAALGFAVLQHSTLIFKKVLFFQLFYRVGLKYSPCLDHSCLLRVKGQGADLVV